MVAEAEPEWDTLPGHKDIVKDIESYQSALDRYFKTPVASVVSPVVAETPTITETDDQTGAVIEPASDAPAASEKPAKKKRKDHLAHRINQKMPPVPVEAATDAYKELNSVPKDHHGGFFEGQRHWQLITVYKARESNPAMVSEYLQALHCGLCVLPPNTWPDDYIYLEWIAGVKQAAVEPVNDIETEPEWEPGLQKLIFSDFKKAVDEYAAK